MIKKTLIFTALLAGTLAFSGCSSYKMDIQQGNVVEQEDVANITVGMSQSQVEEILGTPLLQDDFNKDRWDYVYYFKPGGKQPELKSLVIFFRNGVVSSIKK